MTRKPKRIIVEYDDGSSREHDLNTTTDLEEAVASVKAEYACLSPGEKQNHLIVQWGDGWKEVFAVENRPESIHRYQVIERMETVGRLYINSEMEYPELIEIHRKPHDVTKVLFL